MACHFELLHLWLCVCVCPFLGQVSLKTSHKHKATGKHFHLKPRNVSLPPLRWVYPHVNTSREAPTVLSVQLSMCSRRALYEQNSAVPTCPLSPPLLSFFLLSPLGDYLSGAPLSPLTPARKISTRMAGVMEVISALTGLTICCLKCHCCYCKTASLSGLRNALPLSPGTVWHKLKV